MMSPDLKNFSGSRLIDVLQTVGLECAGMNERGSGPRSEKAVAVNAERWRQSLFPKTDISILA